MVLAVNMGETVPKIRTYINRHRLSFPHWAPDSEAERAFAVTSVPTTFLVDYRGRIVRRFSGYQQWGGQVEERLIRRYLGGTIKFRITDACDDGQAIHYRLFQDESRDTPWTARWPSEQDNAYVTRSYDVEGFSRIPCPGKRVCYGAESADGRRSWGVGLEGNKGCSGCCRSCPDSGEEADFVKRLICS